MASVKKVTYVRNFVTFTADGRNVTKYFDTAKEAKEFAKSVPDGEAGQEPGQGPVRWEVWYRDTEKRGHSKRFARKADATKFANAVEAQKQNGTFVSARAGEVLFRDYADTWLSGRSLAANSRKRKADNLFNHAGPAIGHKRLKDVSAEDIIALFNGLPHLSETTRLGVYTDVRAVFAFAKDNRRINLDPFTLQSVKSAKPKPRKRKVVPWTSAQVTNVHAALPERYRVTVVLGSMLGLRPGRGLRPFP